MSAILSPEIATASALLLYALSGIAGIAGMLLRRPALQKIAVIGATCGFAVQTLILLMGFHGLTQGGLSIGAYLQMLAWFLVLCGLGFCFLMRQTPPLIFASILSLILYAVSAPVLGDVVRVPEMLRGSFYVLHVGSLFLSLALIAIAAAAGVVFLILEGRIKQKLRLPAFLRDMPALGLLDRINAVGVLAGFPLYTLGIVSGLFWAAPAFGTTVSGDPKEIVSILIWLVFAVLFHNRITRCSWHGRKPAQMMIFVFLLCVFSISVVNVFMNSHHAFIR